MNDSVINGVDYGPLAKLIGVWKGDKGKDVIPKTDGEDVNPYYETINFETVGDVTNAGEQTLSVVRYHQVVSRKSNDEVFHDQIGYWIWDPKSQTIIETITIPRAVTILAGGTVKETDDGKLTIEVKSEEGDGDWGILQSPFMKDKARTKKFTHSLTISKDTMEYSETTFIDIYGKKSFEHVDSNVLSRQ